MSDLPKANFLANKTKEDVSLYLPSTAKHICIDKNPLSELVLRLTLAKYGLGPKDAPSIYGYYDEGSNCYYFLNKEQHQELKDNKPAPCKE